MEMFMTPREKRAWLRNAFDSLSPDDTEGRKRVLKESRQQKVDSVEDLFPSGKPLPRVRVRPPQK